MGEFKQGDMVEIISMGLSLKEDGDYEIGDVCEVAEVLTGERSHDYAVWTTDKSNFWYFYEKELKHANN